MYTSLFSGDPLLPSHPCSPLTTLLLWLLRPFPLNAGSPLVDFHVVRSFLQLCGCGCAFLLLASGKPLR